MLQIAVHTFNDFYENTIIAWDEGSLEAAVIDPGNSNPYEDEKLKNFINENNLNVKYLINTHCHIDHILGLDYIKKQFNPVYFAPEKDIPLLKNAGNQAEMFGMKITDPPDPEKLIDDDTQISLGNITGRFLFTPGHTPGEYCLYFEKEKICITGDVLFRESIGRADLWGGDFDTLLHSIQSKLMILPDDVKIFPGHGVQSTIGYERINNPFLQ